MLETERCLLKTLKKHHSSDVQQLYTNEQVRKYLGGTRSGEKLEHIFSKMINSNKGFYWVVSEKQTEHFMGLVSITQHHDSKYLEISYQFLPDWWGSGYATEVISYIIRYAFEQLKLSKLVAETQAANTASCKLLERVGMKREKKVIRFGAEQVIYSIV